MATVDQKKKTTYELQLVNSTDQAYHFAIYQKYPDGAGLTSVAWKVLRLGHHSHEAATWELQYSVIIADWDKKYQAYSGKQPVDAELKKSYEVHYADGDIPDINEESIGPAADGQIDFVNNTKEPLNMGFGIDGKLLVFKKLTHPGEHSQFYVHPTYYVACYRSVTEGQMVDSAVALKPVEVKFEKGYTTYKVEADIDDGVYYLKKPVPISTP